MNEQELGTTPRSESMTRQIIQTTQQTTQDPIDLLSPMAGVDLWELSQPNSGLNPIPPVINDMKNP